jgi:hypothetical protein
VLRARHLKLRDGQATLAAPPGSRLAGFALPERTDVVIRSRGRVVASETDTEGALLSPLPPLAGEVVVRTAHPVPKVTLFLDWDGP